MTYLTETEFLKLGFEDVEDFETLSARASLIIDAYIKTSTISPILRRISNHARRPLRKQSLIK